MFSSRFTLGLFFWYVAGFFIKECNRCIAFVDMGGVFLISFKVKAVSFVVGYFFTFGVEIDFAVEDEFPLALMGVFWYVGIIGEFHEYDLMIGCLGEVAGYGGKWEVYLG